MDASIFRFRSNLSLPFRCNTLVCGLDPFASIFLRGSLIRGTSGQLIGTGMCSNGQTSGNSFRQDQPSDKSCNVYRLDSEEQKIVACTFTFPDHDVSPDWADKVALHALLFVGESTITKKFFFPFFSFSVLLWPREL